MPIGQPHVLRLPDGRFITAVQRFDGGVRTALHWLNPEQGTLREFLRLPSDGDTGWAGLVWHDGGPAISYSSHEGRASIYRAQGECGGSYLDSA